MNAESNPAAPRGLITWGTHCRRESICKVLWEYPRDTVGLLWGFFHPGKTYFTIDVLSPFKTGLALCP